MKINLYKKICKYCDKILLSNSSSVYTHSITSLHVLKEHPVLLEYYFDFKKKMQKEKNPLIKKIFFYILDFFFERKNFDLSSFQKLGSDVLIISNIINISHAKKTDDFYFGHLEKFLNKKKIKTFTALRNFSNVSSTNLKDKLKKNKILLYGKSPLLNEIEILFRIVKEYFLIKTKYKLPRIPYIRRNFLSLFSFRSMVYNLRLKYQIQELIKIINPKLIIIPFEGHAWERVIIKSIKDINPNIKIAAYQFSITTKFQHSIFRPLKKDYNPDIIFTTGTITKKKLEKKYKCKVEIIGSNKFRNFNVKKIKIKNNFLIIPEGFESETDLMLNFVKSLSKNYKSFKFYFRIHPLMKIDKYKKKVTNYKNIIISKNSLTHDFKTCSYVIFRGSAAVFEAIKYGLRPIYLKTDDFDINPLQNIYPTRINITKNKDLKNVIRCFKNEKINKKLIKYVDDYFEKVNFKNIEKFIKNLN